MSTLRIIFRKSSTALKVIKNTGAPQNRRNITQNSYGHSLIRKNYQSKSTAIDSDYKNDSKPAFPSAINVHDNNRHEESHIKWPKTLSWWTNVVKAVYKEYRDTWRDPDEKEEAAKRRLQDEELEKQVSEWIETHEDFVSKNKKNVRRNTVYLRKEGAKAITAMKDRTGIYNLNDLKSVMKEMMRLAIECVSEFTKGYRAGRDAEIERVLNEYFKKLDENEKKQPKRKRRKIKRRDLTFITS